MSDGFTFSGQLGTDYDYNNETLKVEFVFNTQDLGGNPLEVPTESEIKSELKVNGQALDFTSGTEMHNMSNFQLPKLRSLLQVLVTLKYIQQL